MLLFPVLFSFNLPEWWMYQFQIRSLCGNLHSSCSGFQEILTQVLPGTLSPFLCVWIFAGIEGNNLSTQKIPCTSSAKWRQNPLWKMSEMEGRKQKTFINVYRHVSIQSRYYCHNLYHDLELTSKSPFCILINNVLLLEWTQDLQISHNSGGDFSNYV